MEDAAAYWRVVAQTARRYLARVQERQFGAAAGLVKQFTDVYGPSGLADVCAVLVRGAVTVCPQGYRTADGGVDAGRLVPRLLPVAVRRRMARRHFSARRPKNGSPEAAPAVLVERVVSATKEAHALVAEALAAGPGLREIRAVLSTRIDRDTAGPALAYAAGACHTAGVKPGDLAGVGLDGSGPSPAGP